MNRARTKSAFLRSRLCVFVLTVLVSLNLLAAIPSERINSPFFVFATSDNEDSQTENTDNKESSSDSNEQQEQGTIENSDETDDSDGSDDGNGVASEQDNTCPAVAFEGPSYTDENGCPAPCPEDNQDSVPEGCTQQQQQQPMEQSTIPPPATTDDPANTVQEEHGTGSVTDESLTLSSSPHTLPYPRELESGLLEFETPRYEMDNKEVICEDKLDNDRDGWTDRQDSDCPPPKFFDPIPTPKENICNDGKDNDLDGTVDMEDGDCFGGASILNAWNNSVYSDFYKPPNKQGLCSDGLDTC